MRYRVAVCCMFMLVFSVFATSKLVYGEEGKEEEKQVLSIGIIADSAVTAGKLKPGQTVYASVTVKNTDVSTGFYFIEFYVRDEKGIKWSGESKLITVDYGRQHTYSLGWTVPDEAPVGSYSAYVELYTGAPVGEKSELDSREHQDAFHVISSQESYFIANLVDKDTGEKISPPASLKIVERFGRSVIKNYTLTIDTIPARFNTTWSVPRYNESTVVELTALRDGYKPSAVFLYTIIKNSPSSGKLFNNTFALQRLVETEKEQTTQMEPQEVVKKINYDNEEYIIQIKTTSKVETVTLDQPLKKIIFNIEEQGTKGFVNITMSKTLISGPFIVNRSDLILTQNSTHSSIYLEYDEGEQVIEVTGSSIVPEFPLNSNLVTIAAVSVGIVITIVFGRVKIRSLRIKNSVICNATC